MGVMKRKRGNALPILIVLIGVLVLAIAIFTVNYSKLVLTNKEAKTAIDAAALQAALDMSRVVITHERDKTYFGNVALVDDIYTDSKGNFDDTKRPVLGINTIMATIRLDAIIADQLKNTTMLVAAMEDLNRAKADSTKLRDKLQAAADGEMVYDKNGQRFSLVENANKAYDANAIRLAAKPRDGNIHLEVGISTNATATNVPIPTPDTLAQASGKTYLAKDVPATVLGHTMHFGFAPTADQVTLADSGTFVPNDKDTKSFVAPTCVRATATQTVATMETNSESSEEAKKHKLVSTLATACAQAGGPIRTFPSGTLQIAFPGISGPPQKVGVINFSNVQSIMNTSQLTVANADNTDPAVKMGSNSQYTGWNIQDKGAWLQATGGAIPAIASAKLNPANDNANYRGRTTDDPSVVLAFEVYDWLKHMYLRPNISSVVDAMKKPLWTTSLSSNASHNHIAQGVFQLAYADSARIKYNPTFGFFKVPADGEGDPRDLRQFNEHPDESRRMFPNVFGQNPNAAGTLPRQTLITSIDEQGNAVTVNGQSSKLLFELLDQIVNTNTMASQTLTAAQEAGKRTFADAQSAEDVLVEIKQQIDKQGQTPQLVEQFKKQRKVRDAALVKVKRTLDVLVNAEYISNVTLSMLNDRKLITSMGVTKVSPANYQLLGGDFFPITKAATVQEILGDQAISTGQDSQLKVKDWSAKPLEGISELEVFTTSKSAAIGHNPTNDTFTQPVLAVTAEPGAQQNITMFFVDATGKIQTMSPTNTLFGVNILDQQFVYQNTACLITGTDDRDINLTWNLVNRNNGSVDYGGYWANHADPGSNMTMKSQGIPTLIAEWTLRCPAPQFCKENGKIKAIHVDMATNDLRNVVAVTDSAGNITYTFGGKPMSFLDDYKLIAAAHDAANQKVKTEGARGQALLSNSLMNAKTDALSESTEYLSTFEVGTPGWFDKFGKPITSASEEVAGTVNSKGRGQVLTGTASSTGSMRYVWTSPDPAAGGALLGVTRQYSYAVLSVYNAAYFTLQDASGCAQLYFWSS